MSAAPVLERLELRWYQRECIDALFQWFHEHDGDPLAVLPTGAGKSLILSGFIAEARANYPQLRACVLATQGELVKQNAKAARTLLPYQDVGIYSAGLKSKDASRPVTVANIQSLARAPFSHQPFDLLVVDEAHTIADQDAGQYRTFIRNQRLQNPNMKVVGLTATPYKLSSGLLHEGPSALFAGIAYEAPVGRLIEQGYLCRPITPRSSLRLSTSGVAVRGGEFVASALAEVVDVDDVTESAVEEMVRLFADRHHWVVFAVSVQHAQHIGACLERHGVLTTVVHGELSSDERAYRLQAFDSGEVRAIVNCQLLTTGWDCQKIDAIALLRPTKSAGLYVQMLGRGMRVHPSKTNCLVADFAGLIEQFGPIDAIRVRDKRQSEAEGEAVVKVCPSCETYVPAGVRTCISCGHEFPPPPVQLAPVPSTAAILSTDMEPRWVDVTGCEYSYNPPKAPKVIPTLRVTYLNGFRHVASEWVCLEHDGFARTKAQQWWAARSPDNCPNTITQALTLTDDLRVPTAVALVPDGKYQRVTDYRFADDPVQSGPCVVCQFYNGVHDIDGSPLCTKWNATPPVDVQRVGCPSFKELSVELPF
jgi:DNA repair protein RadD